MVFSVKIWAAISSWGDLNLEFVNVAIAKVIDKCNQVEETVQGKLKSAQQRQTVEYNGRKRQGNPLTTVSVGGKVLKKNARKLTRQGGRLQPEYAGTYNVKSITSSGH